MFPLALSALALLASAAPSLTPAGRTFARAYPAARLLEARFGGLEQASGLAAPRQSGDDEENARLFLAAAGAPFGTNGRDLATVRVSRAPGRGGTALFRRTVEALPVFGGEIAVTWRADGAITLVNGSRALATHPAGSFLVTAEEARQAAVDAAAGAAPVRAGPAAQGWIEFGGELWPVWRVAYETAMPSGAFTAFVDAGSGRLLYRVSRRHTAQVLAYKDSPLEPFPPVLAPTDVPDLVPGTLRSARAEAFNCLGADQRAISTGTCARPQPDGGGDFIAPPDLTFTRTDDPFAAQSAFVHIAAQSRFFDQLDPSRAGSLVGFVNAFVNVTSGGGRPFDNAFYQSPDPATPGAPAMLVCGQGTLADFAYDAEIIYHELTHAAVDVTAGFESFPDALGLDNDPGSLNEGTADTFAFANPNSGDPCISKYVGAAFGLECLRQAENRKTCRGNGSSDGSNPGRDGEVHDDGEIWLGFTWALWSEAEKHGAGDAMSQVLFRALESVGSRPSFDGYAESVRQAAVDLFPSVVPGEAQAAADFVACTIEARDLAGCGDRSVAIESGERIQGVIQGFVSGRSPAPQQYFIDVPCGATALHVASGTDTGDGVVYVRYGQPVTFALPGSGAQFDWVVPGDHAGALFSAGGCTGCSTCEGRQTGFGAGRWYFLPAGSDGSVFTLGLSIDVPNGVELPVRVPYLFGDGLQNVCTWGGESTPANRQPPVPASPPALACAAPQPSAELPPLCASGGASAVLRLQGRACGCGTSAPGASFLFLLALLARLRRHRRRNRAAARVVAKFPGC